MPSDFDVSGKEIWITGGSKGLGKELAKQLAARGANITILARNENSLALAQSEIIKARRAQNLTVSTISVDLTDAETVNKIITTATKPPSILILSAGGTPPAQIGFFADLPTSSLTDCFSLNYLTSLFPAHSLVRLWVSPDCPQIPFPRHIIFVNSLSCVVSVPGYVAYQPAKAALRGLHDTLRQELLLYGGTDKYRVSTVFPGCFTSDSFLAEQATKPELTKAMEHSEGSLEDLVKSRMSAKTVAEKTIKGLEKGKNYITLTLEDSILFNNMRGVSPRSGLGIWDSFLGFLGWFIMAVVTWNFDRMTGNYGRKQGLRT